MNFLNVYFWEFVQNLLPVCWLIAAVWWWSRQRRAPVIAWGIVGGVATALVIRFTEVAKIQQPAMESVETTLVNVLAMSAFMLLGTFYLGSETRWSNRRTDVVLGIALGIILTALQVMTIPDIGIRRVLTHGVSFIVAFPLVLVRLREIRRMKTMPAALAQAALVAAAMSLVIVVIDYADVAL